MFLMGWDAGFPGSTTYNPSSFSLHLVKDSFSTTTGILTAHIVANLAEDTGLADTAYQVYSCASG